MAEAGTLCINADVEKKAGANASSTADAEAYTNVYIKMAEGQLAVDTRFDWVTNYASINAISKELLRQAASSLAAIFVIIYDMSGFTSRAEAQTMLDVNWATYRECVKIIKEGKNRTFMGAS